MQHKPQPGPSGHSEAYRKTARTQQGGTMKLMIDLFSTDYGLMSLAVILLIIVMAAFFTRLFLGKMKNVANTPLE
jgi:hypothetical protein